MRETLIELYRLLVDRFDEGELRTLCFHAGVDYDSLPGQGKANKARELVAYCERHQAIPELVRMGEQLRPDIAWDLAPQPNLPAVAEPLTSPPILIPGKTDARRAVPQQREFRHILRFLQSVWGILAGVSLLLPLATRLLNIIPLTNAEAGGKLHHIQPAAVLVITSLTTLFMVLQVIGGRHRLRAELRAGKRDAIQRKTQTAFAAGVSALVLFFLFYFVVFDLIDGLHSLDWQILSLLFLLNDLAMLALHAIIFASLTRAFMLLGMIEYLGAPISETPTETAHH